MITVSETDKDVLRLLWVEDITEDEPEPFALRFTRVVFGVSSSPFLLNTTIRFHLEIQPHGKATWTTSLQGQMMKNKPLLSIRS